MNIEDIINRKELSERLDGDFELFKELVEIFLTDSDKLIKNIEDAINDKDTERIRKSAHTLKGAVSNFSAEDAYNASLEMENIGRNNELEKTERALNKLKETISSTKEAMNHIVAENKL